MMEYSNDSITKALSLLENGIRDEVMAGVKRELRREPGHCLAYIAMQVFSPKVDAHPLDVGLVYDQELMATTNIRAELLEGFAGDPEFHAERIKATAAELRALADELEALKP